MLTGKFHVAFKEMVFNNRPYYDQRVGDGTVKGTIKDAKTLKVIWDKTIPEEKPDKNGWKWHGSGEGSWTKLESRTNMSPTGDAEEPSDVTLGDQLLPRGPRKSQPPRRALLGPRTDSTRGLDSQDAQDFEAEPLKYGVVLANDLSIAIVRAIAKHGDAAEITLGFRRIGSRGKGHQPMELTVHDDRSNKYNQSFSLDNQNLEGTPPAVEQLPVGFTWVSTIEVQMPGIAIGHIAKIELSEGFFGGKNHSLDFQNSRLPSLEFKIPDEQLLSPGKELSIDKNLVAKIGKLTAGSSPGISFSLPISVTNEDYNPHPCKSLKLYVQSENGEVREYATIGEGSAWTSEDIPGKSTKKLGFSLVESASRVFTAEGLHAVLLYRSSNGIFSEPQFCGFIPVPDEVQQRMKRTTSEPSPDVDGDDRVTETTPLQIAPPRGAVDPRTLIRIGGGDSSAATPAGSPGDKPLKGSARSTKITETQPESDFLGEWTNRDFQTLGLTRIRISRANPGSVALLFASGPKAASLRVKATTVMRTLSWATKSCR